MNALDIARWQFGITTVYHFLFVPLTIGLAPLVAIMQTVWYAPATWAGIGSPGSSASCSSSTSPWAS